MNIAVMGGTSHIGRNLAVRFAALPECRLTLFCRDRAPAEAFLRRYAPGLAVETVEGYGDFARRPFDAIINCVGAGTPGSPGFSPVNWFDTLQKFDDLALDYLENVDPRAMLIDFSSGAVYGAGSPGPFGKESCCTLSVNAMETPDFYTVSRLYSEAKHRVRRELRIVDLRIFSFYSRFIPPDAGYFMSDVLAALLGDRVLTTSPQDMIRDYIAPDDLFELVRACLAQKTLNTAIDTRSAKAAGKFEILEEFKTRFGLRWTFGKVAASPNGGKPVYASECPAPEPPGFRPRLTALEGLVRETERRLNDGE